MSREMYKNRIIFHDIAVWVSPGRLKEALKVCGKLENEVSRMCKLHEQARSQGTSS